MSPTRCFGKIVMQPDTSRWLASTSLSMLSETQKKRSAVPAAEPCKGPAIRGRGLRPGRLDQPVAQPLRLRPAQGSPGNPARRQGARGHRRAQLQDRRREDEPALLAGSPAIASTRRRSGSGYTGKSATSANKGTSSMSEARIRRRKFSGRGPGKPLFQKKFPQY